jgi:hypothetical protein
MAMNRRNVLIGLGTVAAGGGAALGTGAFSSVQADRQVSVETAGDASGFLTLEGDGAYVENDSSDTLTIDLGALEDEAFNQDARTVVEGVVTATNNAADGEDIDVGFENDAGDQAPSDNFVFGDGNGNPVADVTLYFGTEDSQSIVTGVGSGGTAKMGVIIDTRSSTLDGETTDGENADVTVLAEDSS